MFLVRNSWSGDIVGKANTKDEAELIQKEQTEKAIEQYSHQTFVSALEEMGRMSFYIEEL